MTIVCGTDFSGSARAAARVAALLAARRGVALTLVHVLELSSVPIVGSGMPVAVSAGWLEMRESAARAAQEEMQGAVASLLEFGVRIETVVEDGLADEVLARIAAERHAELVVVASVGRRRSALWRVGRVTDCVAQAATAPVLVVRESAPFEAWARGERPLRVGLALDFAETSGAALKWVTDLRACGPCDVVRIHVYRRAMECERLGLPPGADDERTRASIERELAADLDGRFGATIPGQGTLTTRIAAGSVVDEAEDLVRIAASERADLIVVGTHQRAGWSRLWHGSVSYRVLSRAAVSVACVPKAAADQRAPGSGLQRVLAVTDFSPNGDSAIAQAFALVQSGGTVTLLHVLRAAVPPRPTYAHDVQPEPSIEERSSRRREIEEQLGRLVPRGAREAGVEARVEVVESLEIARAVCAEAERGGTQALCLGTHGRTGIASMLLGSVAQEILRHSPVPVILVGPRAGS